MSDPLHFHWLRARATCHPTEDLAKVTAALRNALGPPGADAEVHDTAMEAHHGGTQHLLEAELKRDRDVRAALDGMLAGPGAREAVAATLDERIDDEGVLYLRLDKQEAFSGRLVVGTFDDPVSVRVKVQAHPFSRDRAVELWRGWSQRAAPTEA